MKKLINWIVTNKVMLTLSILIVIILTATTFIFEIPFKSYGDIWAHLSYLYELAKPVNQIADPFFHEGTADAHYGIFTLVVAKTAQILKINPVISSFVWGLASIVVFFWVAYNLYLYFFPERKSNELDQVILFIVLFFGWESAKVSYAGYFSMADLAIGLLFPHIFALVLYLVGTRLFLNFRDNALIENRLTKKNVFKIVALSLIFAAALLTHILTGLSLVFTWGIFFLHAFFTLWNNKVPKVIWSMLAVPVIALVLCLLWPYYKFMVLFTDVQSINTGPPVEGLFEIKDWFLIAGVFFIGIATFKEKKDSVLVAWAIGFLLLLLSYYYPIRISSYWRFFPQMLIPLGFMLTYWIVTRKELVLRAFYLGFLLLFGVFSFVNKVNSIGYRVPIRSELFTFVLAIPREEILLSDTETSYLLSGTLGQKVLAVEENHWNPLNWKVSRERFNDSKIFWNDLSNPGPLSVIEKYDISYVLVNTRIVKDPQLYLTVLSSRYRVEELFRNDRFILVHLKR